MLRRNISPSEGLVNGATGTLKAIVRTSDGKDVIALRIAFDGLKEHLIEKVCIKFKMFGYLILTRN